MLSSHAIPGLRYIADGASPLRTEPHVEQSFVALEPDESKYKNYLKPRNHVTSELRMPFWETSELEALQAKRYEGKVTCEEVGQSDLCSPQCAGMGTHHHVAHDVCTNSCICSSQRMPSGRQVDWRRCGPGALRER